MTQKYENIFFETTQELNDQIATLLEEGAVIDSIVPIHSVVFHNTQPDRAGRTYPDQPNIDKICCQEVFVLYHKQK